MSKQYYPDTMYVEPNLKFKVMAEYWPFLSAYERKCIFKCYARIRELYFDIRTELQRDPKKLPEGLDILKIKTLAHEEMV